MDALSAALNSVRVTGAIFFNAEFTAPWGVAVPYAQQAASVLAPGTERLIFCHLVTEGRALVEITEAPDLLVEAGDIVIIPHGIAHTLCNGVPTRLIDGTAAMGRYVSGELNTVRLGGGGEITKFVCGLFGCERHADRLFLAGLPEAMKINLRGDSAGQWLESSIRYLVSEVQLRRPGRVTLLSKMAEVLFIETLRRYMELLPAEHISWLAGARDPIVGATLALMHRKPCHHWTMAELAAEVGASRSVFAERFTKYLGEPPLTYLARWRLQLAARKLETTRNTILQIALDVGYESEAAFNRAFKREFSLPPAQYRRKAISASLADTP